MKKKTVFFCEKLEQFGSLFQASLVRRPRSPVTRPHSTVDWVRLMSFQQTTQLDVWPLANCAMATTTATTSETRSTAMTNWQTPAEVGHVA